MVALLPDARRAALEAQLDEIRKVARAFYQVLFDVILLEIDEGWALVPGFGEQVEGIDLAITVKEAADLPRDTFRDHAIADTETVENLERALRPADGARSRRDDIALVDDDRCNAVEREIDRGGEADRTCADDRHRPASSGAAIQLGWSHEGKNR